MADRQTQWVRFDWPLAGQEFEITVAAGYRLRAARPEDLDAMLAAVAAAYASDPAWTNMTDDIERRVGGRICARLSDPGAYFVLAECADGIVGLNGVAVKSTTGMNLITGICVNPAHQGRGLGVALLGRSLEWLRDQGLVQATVSTDKNAAAARAYDRFGAVRVENVEFPDPPEQG